MSLGKIIMWACALFAGLVVLVFLNSALNLTHYRIFGPAFENARREVYENTKSYRQGSVQRLGTLCTQATNSPDPRLLNGVIREEFQEWNLNDIPQHLQGCLTAARR